MFDIGWGELLVIGVVALVAIGPKELPTVLRTAEHWITERRTSWERRLDRLGDILAEQPEHARGS